MPSKSGDQGQWFSQCLGENGGLCWTLSCNGSSHRSANGVILHNLPACQLDVSYCHSSFDGADSHEGLCSRVYEACLVWTEFFYEKWCWSSSGWKSLNMPVSANQEAEDSCHCSDVLCQRFLCNSLCYISKYHDQGYLGKQPWTQHLWDDNDMTTFHSVVPEVWAHMSSRITLNLVLLYRCSFCVLVFFVQKRCLRWDGWDLLDFLEITVKCHKVC